jgi:pSer/pThr/pTyr-binding forkhead associated (FHA) protein
MAQKWEEAKEKLNVMGIEGKLKYVLRDGPSYTGTFVNNQILGDRERRIITDGTLFTIGATSIILRGA